MDGTRDSGVGMQGERERRILELVREKRAAVPTFGPPTPKPLAPPKPMPLPRAAPAHVTKPPSIPPPIPTTPTAPGTRQPALGTLVPAPVQPGG